MARKKIDRKDKKRHLDFVWLAASEHDHLLSLLGREALDRWILELNGYIGARGKDPYESHYFVIQNWARRAGKPILTPALSLKERVSEAAVLIDAMKVHRSMPADLPKGIADRFRRMCGRLRDTCHAPKNWPEYHNALRNGEILPDMVSRAYEETE